MNRSELNHREQRVDRVPDGDDVRKLQLPLSFDNSFGVDKQF